MNKDEYYGVPVEVRQEFPDIPPVETRYMDLPIFPVYSSDQVFAYGCAVYRKFVTENQSLDYKALLEKYIRHVLDCEGWSYVENVNERADRVQFTAGEQKELERIEAKLEAD